ncbi:MAG: ATP-binding cassette domain-containing protein [Candidatus Moraniibacteriota bacterium]
MNIIEVNKLTKKFGDFTAVKGITFSVKKGEIFGFLGPNGAGKSTTISMLSTLITASGGKAEINNFDTQTQTNEVRRSIGLVFQDPSLDDRLTAKENLVFHARLYGLKKKDYLKRVKEVLDLVELWDRKDSLVRSFSGGMKRRLEIARGLIHYPKVLFLDEPTLGLDPQTRVHIWDYILKLREIHQMTIFMTTHYMNEAEYCDRIAIIDQGKIIALDTPVKLKKKMGGDVIQMKSAEKDKLKAEIKEKYKLKVKGEGENLLIEVPSGESFLPRLFNELDTKIDSIELRKPTLEDVFLKLTGRKIREEEATAKDRMRQEIKVRRR